MAERKKSTRKEPADLLEVALQVVAEVGLPDDVARQVARRAGVPLREVYARFPDESHLIAALSQRIDERMLDADPRELETLPPRDRVFELMMARLEALQPYREALRRLGREARRDPLLMLTAACRLDRSLTWLQVAAELPSRGLRARLMRRILGLVYLRAMRVWFEDDGLDLAKTMAGLDRDLRRVEGLAGLSDQASSATSPEPSVEAV